MAIEVQKEVTRSITKHALVRPEDVAGLIIKAVGAPADTALVPITDDGGNVVGHELSWNETPKKRERKAKRTEGAPAK